MQAIEWTCLPYKALSLDQLYALLRLRAEVFVMEQECPYQDLDGNDSAAFHLLGCLGDELVSYARLLPPGSKYPGASIGRVITSQKVRGGGVGKILMQHAIENCRRHYPATEISISAQQHLEKFYQGLGFNTVSEAYMEDGIPHIEMLLQDQS